MRVRPSFLLALGLVLAAGLVPAIGRAQDVVHKVDGGKLRGKIVSEDKRGVTIDTPGGRLTVPRHQISRVEREGDVFKELEARRAKLSSTDADGFYKLGVWCQE